MVNLNERRFYVSSTASNGVVGADTQLRFVQTGIRVVGKYAGGNVERGCLVGRMIDSTLDFRYLQREHSGEMHSGTSTCDVVEQSDGRVRIVEHFHWRTREGRGTNVFDELAGS